MNDDDVTPFSWLGWLGGWLVGLALSLVVGVAADFAAIAIVGKSLHAHAPTGMILGFVAGITPGLLMVLIARRYRNAFSKGIIVGACMVMLVGGPCGLMVGMVSGR